MNVAVDCAAIDWATVTRPNDPEGGPAIRYRTVIPGGEGLPQVHLTEYEPGHTEPRHRHPEDEVLNLFEPLPQLLRNVRFAGGAPLDADGVKSAIADGEARLNGSGRLVIRPSGTEPLIRVMAEGDDEKLVSQVVKEIVGAVKKAAA